MDEVGFSSFTTLKEKFSFRFLGNRGTCDFGNECVSGFLLRGGRRFSLGWADDVIPATLSSRLKGPPKFMLEIGSNRICSAPRSYSWENGSLRLELDDILFPAASIALASIKISLNVTSWRSTSSLLKQPKSSPACFCVSSLFLRIKCKQISFQCKAAAK